MKVWIGCLAHLEHPDFMHVAKKLYIVSLNQPKKY